MKKLLLFILLLAIWANITNAQTEWAPIGARWYYTMGNLNPQIESYLKCESIGDSMILDEKCKIIQINKPNQIGTPNTIIDSVYMYSKDRKVYWFDEINIRFNLLYDFNANAGDEWVLEGFTGQSNNIVKVDSANTTLINGNELKVLYVHIDDIILFMSGKLIENIGWEGYMFPLVEFSLEGPLRCYEDSVIGYYNTGFTPVCDYHTSIFEYNDKSKIIIYPNPTKSLVNIELSELFSGNILLYNVYGQLIYETKVDNIMGHVINLNDFIPGYYFLKLNSYTTKYQVGFVKL